MMLRHLPVAGLVLLAAIPSLGQEPARIRKAPSNQLISCLEAPAGCPFEEDVVWEELTRRREVQQVLDAYDRTDDDVFRDLIKMLLYGMARRFHDARIASFMRKELGDELHTGHFYVALYLAERGDVEGLETLNRHCYKYALSSYEWAVALDQFGKFKYRPAIPCLVMCVTSASLNAADAAIQSLEKLLPPPKTPPESLEELQKHYEKAAGIDLDQYILELQKRHQRPRSPN